MNNQFNKGLVNSFYDLFGEGLLPLIILPFALIVFYSLIRNGFNNFQFSEPSLFLLTLLTESIRFIPMLLYISGLSLVN